MSSCADVSLTFSEQGFKDFLATASCLAEDERDDINSFFGYTDIHLRDPDDKSHMIMWYDINTDMEDFALIMRVLRTMDVNEYLLIEHNKDIGTFVYTGDFQSNFRAHLAISYNDNYAECLDTVAIIPLSVVSKPTGAVESSTIQDDYVCPGCGNTKTSKVEKSCWRCGCSYI